MPKITLTVRTASKDDFLKHQGIESAFRTLLHCLHAQTFRDFELIYVDTYHENNAAQFAIPIGVLPFPVKHVPIHPNHRYWYDQGWAYMAAATNTAIIHADGELIISLDDAEVFNDDLLQKYWDYYQRGLFMHACHRRMKSIETEQGCPKCPIAGDVYINDGRHNQVRSQVAEHTHGSWLYAGKSFSLADALKLNGFDERLDGNCTLEDCEFGNRLAEIGRKFVFDKEGCVFIVEHDSYVDADNTCKKISRGFVAVENYGVMMARKASGQIEANKHPFTDADLAIIARETLKYRHFDMYNEENKARLAIWRAVPFFDLTAERKQLRA